ncbi:unnamed protein product [Pipistrellus nathusii]|uniref:Uncharacterized protein n=1 Tax=Pipistrellus nathusii TaxID=59473 RepID=A0ABP0A8V0_PIPNA
MYFLNFRYHIHTFSPIPSLLGVCAWVSVWSHTICFREYVRIQMNLLVPGVLLHMQTPNIQCVCRKLLLKLLGPATHVSWSKLPGKGRILPKEQTFPFHISSTSLTSKI